MSESKHTPGSWEVVKHTMSTNYLTIQAPDEHGNLKPVVNMTTHHGDRKLGNARLIAAAPALLDACKRAKAYLGSLPGKYAVESKYLQKTVQAVIKQAEKES